MNYGIITNTGDSVTGWPAGQVRYYEYADELTCAQGEAQFSGLSPAQKIAQTAAAVPSAGTGFHWEARNCAASPPPPTGSDGPWVADADDGPSLVDEGGGGPPPDPDPDPDPIPSDGSAWTGGNPNDVDDQGTAVTYSNPVILTDN